MNEIEKKRRALRQVMDFSSALAFGIEQLVGLSASSMSTMAGRKLGKQFSQDTPKTGDVLEAIAQVKQMLEKNNFLWEFEPFKRQAQQNMITARDDGAIEVQLVFRDCMIRQALFSFGHEQKGSLCSMMYGFFSGALENIMGQKSVLEIIHAGPNACLKRLIVK